MLAAVITAVYMSAFTIFDWEPQEVRLSCYLPTGNRTYDGTVPYEGILACNKEHIGMTAMLFDHDMRFIGFYECRDIGGNSMLKSGTAVDVFRNNMDRAKEFIRENGDWGYVVWLEADG